MAATLSPGKYHRLVPKDLEANMKWRRALLDTESSAERACIRLMCSEDILFYINSFVWQFNPKKRGHQVGPFLTWDFQEELLLARPETWTGRGPERGILWAYDHNRTVVVEKSREMGLSWLFLIFQDWLCIFSEYSQCLNISRSADAVDCKSPDSLFWKLRFMHKYLPDWLVGKIVQQDMYIEYQKSNSWTTGEASTGRAGIGGRAAVIFVDEYSQIKEDIQVRQGTANTSDCRFFNGTHQGTDTEFYRMTQSPEVLKLVAHWSQHPDKKKGLYRFDPLSNRVEILDKGFAYPAEFEFVHDTSPDGGPYPGLRSPWYDWKSKDIGSKRGTAMELDINPEGSVSQFIDQVSEFLTLISLYCRPPDWVGKVLWDKDTGRPVGLEKDARGPLKLWIKLKGDGLPPLGVYKIGCDLAGGTGRSNSCLSIVDGATGEKVGELATPDMLPDQMGLMTVALCWLFKNIDGEGAQVVWEKHGPGVVFGKTLLETGYRNVYDPVADKQALAAKWRPSSAGEYGFVTTVDSKRTLLEEYRSAILGRKFLNHSEAAMREFFRFKYTPNGAVVHMEEESRGDPSGARINHGDRVIADALAWRLARQTWAVRKQEREQELPVLSFAWRTRLHEEKRERETRDIWAN